MSVVNSNLWQARLEVVEQSRTEHRCYGFSSIFLFTFGINFSFLCYTFVSVISILNILFCFCLLLVFYIFFLLCFMLFSDGISDYYVIQVVSVCLETLYYVMLSKAQYML